MKWVWYDYAMVAAAALLIVGVAWLFFPVGAYFFPTAEPALPEPPAQDIQGDAMDTTSGPEQSAQEQDLSQVPESGGWINSLPLDIDALQAEGKVIVIDFWTHGCINCIRDAPHMQALYEKYQDEGLIMVGVHTAEFAWERDPVRIAAFAEENGLTYPILTDADKKIWKSFNNHYWPAMYVLKDGKVIYSHFGEGDYPERDAAVAEALA